jgi:hypothetical protein
MSKKLGEGSYSTVYLAKQKLPLNVELIDSEELPELDAEEASTFPPRRRAGVVRHSSSRSRRPPADRSPSRRGGPHARRRRPVASTTTLDRTRCISRVARRSASGWAASPSPPRDAGRDRPVTDLRPTRDRPTTREAAAAGVPGAVASPVTPEADVKVAPEADKGLKGGVAPPPGGESPKKRRNSTCVRARAAATRVERGRDHTPRRAAVASWPWPKRRVASDVAALSDSGGERGPDVAALSSVAKRRVGPWRCRNRWRSDA